MVKISSDVMQMLSHKAQTCLHSMWKDNKDKLGLVLMGLIIKERLQSPYPGRVGLVELVEHHHRGAAVVIEEPPEVSGGARQRVRRDHKGSGPEETVGERRIDVVAALAVSGDQEGQGAVRRQDVHASVLLSVPGHQRNAALFHIQVRGHRVQSLKVEDKERHYEGERCVRGEN